MFLNHTYSLEFTFFFNTSISGQVLAIDFNSATKPSKYPTAVGAGPTTCTPNKPPDEPANEDIKLEPHIL